MSSSLCCFVLYIHIYSLFLCVMIFINYSSSPVRLFYPFNSLSFLFSINFFPVFHSFIHLSFLVLSSTYFSPRLSFLHFFIYCLLRLFSCLLLRLFSSILLIFLYFLPFPFFPPYSSFLYFLISCLLHFSSILLIFLYFIPSPSLLLTSFNLFLLSFSFSFQQESSNSKLKFREIGIRSNKVLPRKNLNAEASSAGSH